MDYGRLSARLQFGTNSDLSFPDLDSHLVSHNCSPTKYQHMQVGTSTTSKTIPLSQFATVIGVFIVNKSATAAEIIDVTTYETYGIKTFTGVGLSHATLASAATGDTITDDASLGILLTTYKANLASHVAILGSATAANNALWEIHHATATPTLNVITLATDSGRAPKLTADAANASVTLEFVNQNRHQLAAGGFLCKSGTFSVTQGLSLLARSGTPEVDLYILGT